MKKNIYLFTSIILIIIIVIWKFYLTDYLTSFHQIDEWGIYLFSVPITYCIVAFFSSPNVSSIKIIVTIFVGVLISILLTRNATFLCPKILVALAGALLTWAFTKVFNNKI